MTFNQFIQSLDISNSEALRVRTLLESQVTDHLEQVATSSTGQNVALASSIAKIVFRDNLGWIGPESENYIGECEKNWYAPNIRNMVNINNRKGRQLVICTLRALYCPQTSTRYPKPFESSLLSMSPLRCAAVVTTLIADGPVPGRMRS